MNTEQIYEQLVMPLVEIALLGGTGTLFAYGQTGSGKTFTISSIEKTVAEHIFREETVGSRNISISIFELGSTLNSGFGLSFVPTIVHELITFARSAQQSQIRPNPRGLFW